MERTKDYAVFVASHIRYEGQLKLLLNAIKSVKNQDYKDGSIDIWLSISFDNCDFKDEFDALNIADDCFKCYIQEHRMYQLEHLKVLNDNSYNDYKYELILFLDDDDEYTTNRITKFDEILKDIYDFDKGIYRQTQVLWEDAKALTDNNEVISCFIYWTFGVKQQSFNAFFDLFKQRHLQHHHADMLLKMYFERLLFLNDEAVVDNGLYMYNTNNSHSISALKSSVEKKGNSGVYLMTCMNDSKYMKNKFGNKFKSKIDNDLWRVCYEIFHKFKTPEEFFDNLAVIINRNHKKKLKLV